MTLVSYREGAQTSLWSTLEEAEAIPERRRPPTNDMIVRTFASNIAGNYQLLA